MIELNLPSFEVRVGGTPEKPFIFDRLRRKYVALTPEEWVRQHFVNFLTVYKGYPAELLANEVPLNIGNKSLRADTIVYDKLLNARMIVEYKSPAVTLSRKSLEQAGAYNTLLKVGFLAISNGLQHYCCKVDYEKGAYNLMEDIPRYEDILQP